MIKIERIVTPSPKQMAFVIEGMRNPMNSWDQSDSTETFLGPNDFDLMARLMAAGSDERKFMRQMPLMMRITAPMYWWKEFDTYKVGTVRNSCSTMHKVHTKEFVLEDFSTEHLDPWSKEKLVSTIDLLNIWREEYLMHSDNDPDTGVDHHTAKDHWWQLIQLLPASYNQTANVTLNYEVARNMYWARRNHKLDEWHKFCGILSDIPYSFLITTPAKTGGK